jgi:hypothetical protein
MSERGSDPYSSAKDNLRDTVKWLATTLAALLAALLAGTSIKGITTLTPEALWWALPAGAAGVIAILSAVAVLLRLLVGKGFFLNQLETDSETKDRLQDHAIDILPPEFGTLDEFLALRRQAIEDIRDNRDNPDFAQYKAAVEFFTSAQDATDRIVNLAHLEILRRDFRRDAWILISCAVVAVVGLGAFSVLTATSKGEAAHGDGAIIAFSPGNAWGDLAGAFAAACGASGPFMAQITGGPRDNWVTLRLLSPQACAGQTLSVPAQLVAAAPGQAQPAQP